MAMEYRISEKLRNMKPSAIREIFKSLTDPSIIPFAAGNPAAESFPAEAIAEISADIFNKQPAVALQYGITEGYPKLREQISGRLHDRFGIDNENNTLIITSGGQQAIELACKTMCDPGDVVLCEDPTFIGALNAFRSNGAVPVGLPLYEDGIDPAALEEACKKHKNAKLLYLIPTFHNPCGTTTSFEKRAAVYEIAKKYGLIIIEDDPYGELRFSGEDIPKIKSLDKDGIVLYCGSMSKVLSAGMRIGFVSGANEIIQKMVVAKQVEDVHSNQFFQMVTSRFISDYSLDEHIGRVRGIYRRKCAMMINALEQYMPDSVSFTRPQGGLFVWLTLPESIDPDKYVKEALSRKAAVVPGGAFSPDNSPSRSFRITYSTPTEEQIINGVRILADVAKELSR